MALFKKTKDAETPKAESTKAASSKAKASDTKEKKVEKKTVEKKEKVVVAQKLTADRDLASVLKKPRITEKAALQLDRNVYTFEVRRDATKHDVRDAVKKFYDVSPISINMVNKQPRHYVSRSRGRKLMEKGLKKAYVQLKEGDRIDLA